MKKAMLFIGNGFDRALGYATGYDNFYQNSSQLKKYASTGNKLCNHILKNFNGVLWSDLENGLYQYSLNLTKQFGEGNKTIADKFQKEFQELRNALFHYLTQESGNPVPAANSVSGLLQEWKRVDLQCLSFNYTSLILTYLNGNSQRYCLNQNDSINTDYMIYCHGSLYDTQKGNNTSDDIILGIDDSQKVEQLHDFLYKSHQKVIYNNYDLVQNIKAKDIFIIYGCSMGDSDKFYFEQIFNANFENKQYLIYGFGGQSISSLQSIIHNFVGNLNEFKSKNKFDFIDCKDPQIHQKTKYIIDVILQ